KPIPREKLDIAVAHAIAAELLGFKMIYLEAGSGAKLTVPNRMIEAIRTYTSLPIIVGGGIRTADEAREKVRAGATCVVCGTLFEDNNYNFETMKEIATTVKS
ncbi:MAG: tryptophan synthase subunit alpha, partial [Calditrichaeota bacterium]|nr:tryptophan synthase subunit alpha [Calditrichota bacterium]